MQDIKISILVSCYNSEKFIKETINSILQQTYKNWECILVDDGSCDNTLSILHTYQAEDHRIKVIAKERSGRPSPNLNIASYHATGNFILLCGHDDYFSNDLLEKLVERHKETKADIVIPDCCFIYSDPTKNWTFSGINKIFGKASPIVDRSHVLSNKEAFRLSVFWNIHGFAMWNAEIVKKHRFYEGGMNGDEFSSRIFFYYGNKIVFSRGTYFYRQHEYSMTKKFSIRLFDTYKCLHRLEIFCMIISYHINL